MLVFLTFPVPVVCVGLRLLVEPVLSGFRSPVRTQDSYFCE